VVGGRDGEWRSFWIGASSESAPEGQQAGGKKAADIVIGKALYGVKGNPAKQVDLTEKLRRMVSAGTLSVKADNETAGRDPAYMTVKTLELEYTVDGKPVKRSLAENTELDLATGRTRAAVARAPTEKTVNQWTCYRRVVHLEKAPRRAGARIAADSKYWLWINGELVVFEGQLKRGPTPDDTYYDRVELTGRFRKGENTIAVLLWYFGKHGFSHKSSGKSGLVFDAELDGKPLLSDRGWKAVIHPSFGDTGKPHPNFRLPESNIRFDAGKDMPGWQNPGFDDSSWRAAAEYGRPPRGPWNRLVERPIPLWKDYGLKDYVNAEDLPTVSDGSTIKAKIPYNAHVTPYLKVEAPAGQTIDIRMDNYKGGGPPNVRAEYVTLQGVQEYENPGWMNGHEVHYTIPAGVKILALKYRETGYNSEFTGTFECDDDFLNRYRQKALRTLYVTMRDTYYDCPDRERAQWWGDMVMKWAKRSTRWIPAAVTSPERASWSSRTGREKTTPSSRPCPPATGTKSCRCRCSIRWATSGFGPTTCTPVTSRRSARSTLPSSGTWPSGNRTGTAWLYRARVAGPGVTGERTRT